MGILKTFNLIVVEFVFFLTQKILRYPETPATISGVKSTLTRNATWKYQLYLGRYFLLTLKWEAHNILNNQVAACF